jgi:NADH-ubiquinone oxidoreductase chain 5
VIHALANEQDIRKFGGLQQILIFSYTCLLIGTLALVGTPFLTGFYSKDVILELAYARYSLSANFSYLLTCFSVLTTSYYSFRLLFMTFFSHPSTLVPKTSNLHKSNAKNAHDADIVMAGVLIILALGSIYAGWFFKPMFIGLGSDFWNNSLMIQPGASMSVEAEFLPQTVKLLPLIGTTLGAILAYTLTMISVKRSYLYAAYSLRSVYLFLNQRWLYDKLLNELVAYRCYKLGFSFVKVFDKGLLELLPIFGLGLPRSLKSLYIKLGATQSGLIYHYAILMIFTALISLTVLSFDNLQLFLDARVAMLMGATLLVL